MKVNLRKYQEEAVNSVLDAINRNEDSGILYLATGTGKTVIAGEIIRKVNKKTIMVVHREELASQSLKKILMMNPSTDVGIVKAEFNQLGRKVTIASIQTLLSKKRLQQVLENGPYELVILDEAHHYRGNKWAEAAEQFKGFRLGLTATPNDLDEDSDGKILYRYSIFEAIKNKHLVDIHGIRCSFDIDWDKIKIKNGDFQEDSLANEMMKPENIKFAYESWLKHSSDRKTVIFCVNIAHAMMINKYFLSQGVPIEYVIGETENRNEIYTRFESGETKVLASVNVLTEGWDSPGVSSIIMARPTLSETLYIQAIGRGLRPFPGKENCLILDLVGNSERHRMVQLGILFGKRPKKADKEKEVEKKIKDLGINKPEDLPEIPSILELIAREENISLENTQDQRKFEWVDINNRFVLTMGNNKLGFLMIEKSSKDFNSWAIKRYYSKGWKDQVDVLEDGLPFDWCISIAEKEVERFLDQTELPLINKNSSWRYSFPTPKQLEMLKSFGCTETPKTKGDASKLITQHMIKQQIDNYRPAIETEKGKKIIDAILKMSESGTLKVTINDFNPDSVSVNEINRIKVFHEYNKNKTPAKV